jgi:hypothetical protein
MNCLANGLIIGNNIKIDILIILFNCNEILMNAFDKWFAKLIKNNPKIQLNKIQ